MSVPPTPADHAATVRDETYTHSGHRCNGLCPDIGEPGPDSRDPECFYCRVLTVIDALAARADELERELREARFPEIDESLLPDHVISASWSPEVLAAAAQAHCRHQWDHDMEVKAWVVLTLLRDRERAERAEAALREAIWLIGAGHPHTTEWHDRADAWYAIVRAALGEQPPR